MSGTEECELIHDVTGVVFCRGRNFVVSPGMAVGN